VFKHISYQKRKFRAPASIMPQRTASDVPRVAKT
jgi:hypothetical protein